MTTELDALAGAAAEVDIVAAPVAPVDPNAPPPPAPVDYASEARGMVEMFAAMVVGYAPAAADVWNEGVKERVSAALAPVMEKYGVSFGAFPPELTLIIVAGPVLYQSARIVAAQMQVERGKAAKVPGMSTGTEKAGEGAAASPPIDPGTPEQAVHPQVALYR